jgi:hypothetical protein
MNKVQFWYDQEGLLREVGQMMSLVETTRHIKSASSNAMTREMLASHKPDKDHFLLHVIALGDHEHYGSNRNGDAWPKAACIKYHPTFISHGHYFREHRNRSPEQAIGQIKASCYNEDMGRIELAVWGHIKKAEDVLEKVKAGKPIGNSMSARVPNDRSSITGKLSRSPAEYDDYCKYRMNQYIPEHRKFAFVYNDHPTFFDISDVKNPADRIAYTLETELAKAASAGRTGFDLALAEGVELPELPREGWRQAQCEKLASLESYLDAVARNECHDNRALFCKHAAVHSFRGELTDTQLEAFRSLAPAALFRKLAARQTVLPFLSFAAYATNRTMAEVQQDQDLQAARAQLPHIFTKLAKESESPELETLCHAGDRLPGAELGRGDLVDRALVEAGEQFSLEPERVSRRVLINQDTPTAAVKAATATSASTLLARAYGHYQLSALEAMQSSAEVESSDSRNILVLFHNRSHL